MGDAKIYVCVVMFCTYLQVVQSELFQTSSENVQDDFTFTRVAQADFLGEVFRVEFQFIICFVLLYV